MQMGARELLMHYMDLKQTNDVQLTFEALKVKSYLLLAMLAAITVNVELIFLSFYSTWLPFCCTRNLLPSLWLKGEFKSSWKFPGPLWLLLVFLCASITLPTTRMPWKG